jgi:hypothetical protein
MITKWELEIGTSLVIADLTSSNTSLASSVHGQIGNHLETVMHT